MNKSFYDINDIVDFLPHRYPFLLLDRVSEVKIEKNADKHFDLGAVGLKNVTCNEQFFVGHFPENMVMPGVLILEAMGQLAAFGALKYYRDFEKLEKQYNIYFTTIEDGRFKDKVVPGDQLVMYVKKVKKKLNIWKFQCEARVDDRLVTTATLGAAMVLVD